MQHPTRLKYNARALRQFDASDIVRQEQRDASSHAKAHFQSSEIKFDIRYAPDEHFTEFLLYVREHTTEFTCHHHKFYWKVCVACRRDPQQALALKKYHRERVLKVLSEVKQ